MPRSVARGQIVGRPGHSLDDAGWAANDAVRQAGQLAEERTGQQLATLVERGPSVLHDLRIPLPGVSANIDHVIVHGSRVLILDSKQWAGGFYWTLGGKTRRGFERFTPADKKTLPMAQEAISRHLSRLGLNAHVERPVLVVWSAGQQNFLCYRPPGGVRIVRGPQLASWAARHTKPQNAHGDLLLALAELAN